MRVLSSDTEQIKLRELIEAVRSEPVTLLVDGEPVAVVLRPPNSTGWNSKIVFAARRKSGCARRSRRFSGKRPSAA
jgi:hypothetical protein